MLLAYDAKLPGGMLPRSSAAKCLVHDLIRPWWICVAAEGRLILVGRRERRQQTFEGREISIILRCSYRLRDQMIARDESRVHGAHRRLAFVRLPVCGVNRLWVMPRDDMNSEAPDCIHVPA